MPSTHITPMDLFLGETPRKKDETPRFVVYHKRDGNNYGVWIKDHLKGTWVSFFTRHARLGLLGDRLVNLNWRPWHLNSPARRIELTIAAAERKAEKLNNSEMYLNHEAEIGVRL